jgi:hypothetical protein
MKIYDASLAGTVTTVSGSTSNLTGSFSGSFSGSYVGNGSGLFNIPASGVTGLELNKIVDGGINATISATQGLRVNTDTIITGSLTVTGNLTAQQFIVSSSVTHLTTSFSSGSQKFGDSIDDTHQFTGSVFISGSQNITGSLIVSIGGSTELNVQQTGVTIGNIITDTHILTGSLNVTGSQTINGTLGVSIGGLTELNVQQTGVTIGSVVTDTHRVSGSLNVSGSINVNNSLYVISNGKVGIGTSSPTNISGYGGLTINGTSGGYTYWNINGVDTGRIITDSSNLYIDNVTTGATILRTTSSSSERVRITTGGNVFVGSQNTLGLTLQRLTVTEDNAVSLFGIYRNNTTTSQEQGGIQWMNGGSATSIARISTFTSSDFSDTGNIVFYTRASGQSQAERMRITSAGVVQPGANGTQDLGTASLRWGTIFTSDLSLSNGIGDYTIVEGEEKLYLYNNKNNKVYSFVLQEEDPLTATPKKS